MDLAVFGGSFDPVHCGHVAVANAIQEHRLPDLLMWMPARRAPHKPDARPAAAQDRLDLLRLVVDERPKEEVSSLELERSGPSYSVHTLEALHSRYGEAELLWVMGADSLEHLPTWFQLERVLELAELLLVPRPRWGPESLAEFRAWWHSRSAVPVRATFLSMQEVDVSSTAIRHKLVAGESCDGLLPKQVESEIHRRGLYC